MDQQRIKLKRDPLSFSLKISLSLSLSLTLPFSPNLSLYTSSVYFSHSLCVHISLSSLCITDLKLISQSLSSFLSLFILSTSLFLFLSLLSLSFSLPLCPLHYTVTSLLATCILFSPSFYLSPVFYFSPFLSFPASLPA